MTSTQQIPNYRVPADDDSYQAPLLELSEASVEQHFDALVDIDWDDITEAAPAALTAMIMPFTYSIANGLAFGFISYAALKLFTGRAREVHPATWLVAALFLIRFAFFAEG